MKYGSSTPTTPPPYFKTGQGRQSEMDRGGGAPGSATLEPIGARESRKGRGRRRSLTVTAAIAMVNSLGGPAHLFAPFQD